ERKKTIPVLPARIGVVTSPQAAALRDILNILQRRHHTANVLIFPAQVQGDAAALEVANGVRYFNESRENGLHAVEVIIIARGGGSAEDLSAFNDEGLARTVAASQIPVISAVGHETDFTICDFVADLRAPTPSAAAELVIRSRAEIENASEGLRERLVRAMERRLLQARHALIERAQHGAFARMMDLIRQRQQKMDDLAFRLERGERAMLELNRRRLENVSAAVRHYDLRRVLAGVRAELQAQNAAMTAAMRNQLLLKKLRLERIGRALETLSPLSILERGYALVFDSSGQLIKDSLQVKTGDEISARVARGEIRATVESSFKAQATEFKKK
ncbi:MAG: exodeoxyribonuclease VII large subunit, partial [Candidatus Sulfotelmatobacter sp.]